MSEVLIDWGPFTVMSVITRTKMLYRSDVPALNLISGCPMKGKSVTIYNIFNGTPSL